MIDYELYYIFAVIGLLFSIGSYALIRGIIWSIVWCDVGGKYKNIVKIKSNKPKNISMRHLVTYITTQRSSYDFWMRVKALFLLTEILETVIYIVIPVTNIQLLWPFSINIIQFIAWFIAVSVQYDTNRNTKYDRIRLKK